MAPPLVPASGHGAEMAIELDPDVPDDYTTVGRYTGDFGGNFGGSSFDLRSHDRDIVGYVPGMADPGPWTLSVNYVYGDATHATLKQRAIDRRRFKVRFRGPGGLASIDETIVSGFMESWTRTAPVDGVQTAEGTFRPDGETYLVDGVSII